MELPSNSNVVYHVVERPRKFGDLILGLSNKIYAYVLSGGDVDKTVTIDGPGGTITIVPATSTTANPSIDANRMRGASSVAGNNDGQG